jgi:hypothetical protein
MTQNKKSIWHKNPEAASLAAKQATCYVQANLYYLLQRRMNFITCFLAAAAMAGLSRCKGRSWPSFPHPRSIPA